LLAIGVFGRCRACSVKLFRLLYYYKTYPTERHLAVVLGITNKRNLTRWIRRATTALAAALADIVPSNWNQRDSFDKPAADFYGPDVKSLVDTYPVRCRRPKNRAYQAALYQGKYKTHVVKVSLGAQLPPQE